MNVRLLIEYDGTDFVGWQKQPTGPTIQGTLETILSQVAKERIVVYGAGRTDSGVHALGQVANFETRSQKPAAEWRKLLNHHLPNTIRILEAAEVDAGFHAQKKALSKVYEYRILNRPAGSALQRTALHFPRKLDWNRIREASQHFVGTHDFKSFQGARASVKTTVRTVDEVLVLNRGDGFYAIRFRANGFLKQMVRAMVGTLLAVGEGKIEANAIGPMIEARDRRSGGPTAPANGLFLVKVVYGNWL
jgi:tRNA pseudouridine38-40 synthase